MLYKHVSSGALAELLKNQNNTITLKLIKTGKSCDLKPITFRRWWTPIETRTQDTPIDSQKVTTNNQTDKAKVLALSDVVVKLEKLFDLLNDLYFDGELHRPVITIQSTPSAYGHCSTKKIWKTPADGDDEGQYEVNIGAEFLTRPSADIAATMLHEMVHLFCRERGLDETCQNGRYHNKLFKVECEARDLIIDYDRANGYAYSKPSEKFIEALRHNGYDLNTKFASRIFIKKQKVAARNKAHKYICLTCGQTVRSTSELTLICGLCESRMERFD